MEFSDAAAVAAVLAGDRDAFRPLVERHSRGIFRLAFRLTGNEGDADEIVQETFVRAYQHLKRYESRASFGTWLYRIATNCAFDLLERRKRHVPLEPEREQDDAPADEMAAEGPTPERQAYAGELQQHIAAAMGALTPSERTAFMMRHFDGKSIEEIAATLRIREGAAKNSIFRAVQKMRRALQPAVRSMR